MTLESDVLPSVISVHGLRTIFGKQVVHDGLDMEVRRGEVIGVVGASGSGKSVLLRTIIGLNRPESGTIEVLGKKPLELAARERTKLSFRWGVLFQSAALFSSLTVAQNIQAPIREHLRLPKELLDEIAAVKIAMVGLSPDAGPKYPAQLSGGMRKRAGLARALALDPELLFLDEPTAGLDPVSAAEFDELIGNLRENLDLTVFMVTHDLDSLYAICDRIAVLADKRVLAIAPLQELLHETHPWVRAYFRGPRGRAAAATHERVAASG